MQPQTIARQLQYFLGQSVLLPCLAVAIILGCGFLLPQQAIAQGKLRRVSEAVRKHEPKKAEKARPKAERTDRDEHKEESHPKKSRRQQSRKRDDRNDRGRRRAGHSDGLSFFVSSSPSPVFACSDPVCLPVVRSVAPAVPVPIIVDTLSEPSYVVQETTIADLGSSLGTDWFHDKTSRFWATIGSDFEDISTGGMGLNLQAPASLGVDTSVMLLRESTDTYRDHMLIGDANVLYEVMARGDLRARIGIGANWLNDAWGTEAGLNLTAQLDARLTNRTLLSFEGDVGTLGDADFSHARINVAHRLERCELIAGADHYNLGGVEINSVFTGLQFRF